MRGFVFVIFMFAGPLLFSQKCYVDNTLLVTNGERGQVVSFIFSDDYQYGLDQSGNDYNIFSIVSQGKYLYFITTNHDLKFIITENDEYIEFLQGCFVFSTMKKVDCSEESIKLFNQKLKEFN